VAKASTASPPGFDLLLDGDWQMVPGERAALEGLLAFLRPELAIEIGTAEGGSLRRLASHCGEVHSFDLRHAPDLPAAAGVTLHTGDSHALLPEALEAFEREGQNVDFVLVDGDHTAEGVRRDVEDLLASGALRRTVILAHDASNDEVRRGLDAVDWKATGKVAFLDLDFVPGHLSSGGPFKDQLWGGFAIVVVDEANAGPEPRGSLPELHSAFDVLREGRGRLLSAGYEPLPEPALPWTEALAKWTTPRTRLRIQMAWERLPRREDLIDPLTYLRGMRLQRELFHHGYTMLYPLRGRNLYRLARLADRFGVPGALVDCGTWNGGSTALLAAGAPGRHIWAFDSFEGLPAPSQRDARRPIIEGEEDHYVGECHGSDELLRAAVERFVSPEQLHVRAGWFEETLPQQAEAIGPIAVLHCDSDWYDSVLVTLTALYPYVSPGGWIVIDDYGAVPGAARATRDFRARVGDSGELVKVDQTGRYWRKAL
jgi:predicted O-methyltransferase YrrM